MRSSVVEVLGRGNHPDKRLARIEACRDVETYVTRRLASKVNDEADYMLTWYAVDRPVYARRKILGIPLRWKMSHEVQVASLVRFIDHG